MSAGVKNLRRLKINKTFCGGSVAATIEHEVAGLIPAHVGRVPMAAVRKQKIKESARAHGFRYTGKAAVPLRYFEPDNLVFKS